MVKLRNRAEVDFGSLSQGTFFLFGDGIYMILETFNDDGWTNAVCIESPHCLSGARNNFCLDTKVIPLSEVYIDYEI
jgi:hypothetical protein